MTRCPPLCGQIPERKVLKRRQSTKEDESDLRWTMEERERKEKIVNDHKKVKELIPR